MTTFATRGSVWVALILAGGLVLAVNCVTVAVLYDAIRSQGPGLSENATQVLTGVFGGILSLLGAFIGYTVGEKHGQATGRAEAARENGDATVEWPQRPDA